MGMNDFKEANEAHDTGFSGGGQWRGTCQVLKKISPAMYVAMFADRVAFTEMLQWHKEDFS